MFSIAQLARQNRPATEIGGKARHLATLAAAGLPIPEALVLPVDAELDGEAREAIAALGEPLAIRSSSPLEDSAEHAAPGLFTSRVGVGLEQLDAAVFEVREAAADPRVGDYAAATGREADPAMAVIIQRYIEPRLAGVAYSQAPGDPESLLIEPRGGAVIEHRRGAEAPERWAELIAAVRAAERAIGAEAGVDVEWVEGAGGLWLVQARPLRPGPERRRPPAAAFDFARADPARRWRLDLGHNPEPLSVAQRGLVDLVVERNRAELAIACGYLYEAVPPAAAAPGSITAAELEARFGELEVRADRALAELETRPPDLEAALDTYAEVHRLYGAISEALSAGKRRCAGVPARLGTAGAHAAALASDDRASAQTRERAASLAGLEPAALYAPYTTAWDVAAPELDPSDIADDRPAITPSREATGELAWLADLCAAIAELDDRLFYRAQSLVRRALRARHPGLGRDVFWLPLSEVRGAGRPVDAEARAASARAAYDASRLLTMPVEVQGDRWLEPAVAPDRAVLRGRGFGGRASGAVARLAPGGRGPRAGDVIVAVDMSPGEVIAARRAGAIALEAGSLLGHAAAMARELEIPIIVQIPGLFSLVHEGERVAIDGDRGLLFREVT